MKHIKKWQEPIYAIGGFGPLFLFQFTLSYLLYFYRPAQQLIEMGAMVFAPAVGYSFGMLLARIFEGLIDLPIATWTDNLKSRWGRRRPLMVLGIIPTGIAFILLWYPPFSIEGLGLQGHWGNALYVSIVSAVFFFFYTLITVPYLASLSEIVPDEHSRVRVASWQTFFNTSGYVMVFVAAPILFDLFGVRVTAWMLLPALITFIGPLLVIKEEPTSKVTEAQGDQSVSIDYSFWQSLKMTLGNKIFRTYMFSLAAFFFGLQLFLGGIAFMALDMMGLTQTQLGTMNAAAFAPVPIMLLIFNYISRKKGAKWGLQLALIVFAIVMFAFPLGWTQLGFVIPPYLVGIILGAIGSFSIGVFFTIPYAFPAQIAAVDAEETGKNRAGMFFAVQGVLNSFIGSLAGSILVLILVWDYGVVAIGPLAALACLISYVLIRPYPLGKPTHEAQYNS